jgi:hypothetical protein
MTTNWRFNPSSGYCYPTKPSDRGSIPLPDRKSKLIPITQVNHPPPGYQIQWGGGSVGGHAQDKTSVYAQLCARFDALFALQALDPLFVFPWCTTLVELPKQWVKYKGIITALFTVIPS